MDICIRSVRRVLSLLKEMDNTYSGFIVAKNARDFTFDNTGKVPSHNLQALAILVRHMLPEKRHMLFDPAWLIDWQEPIGEYAYEDAGVSCWITRKGMVYPIGYAQHSTFSTAIGTYNDVLEKAGWIHVSGGRYDIIYEPTSMQRKAMERLKRLPGKHVDDRSEPYHPMYADERLKPFDRIPRDDFDAHAYFAEAQHVNA